MLNVLDYLIGVLSRLRVCVCVVIVYDVFFKICMIKDLRGILFFFWNRFVVVEYCCIKGFDIRFLIYVFSLYFLVLGLYVYFLNGIMKSFLFCIVKGLGIEICY